MADAEGYDWDARTIELRGLRLIEWRFIWLDWDDRAKVAISEMF